jgi:hypothetical protein
MVFMCPSAFNRALNEGGFLPKRISASWKSPIGKIDMKSTERTGRALKKENEQIQKGDGKLFSVRSTTPGSCVRKTYDFKG